MPQAKQLVTSLFAAAPAPVALRAAAMLRQQYSAVKMPTPALSGGLGADQLAAYAGDWDVYRPTSCNHMNRSLHLHALRLSPDASRYRLLALRFHPDAALPLLMTSFHS